MLIVFVNEICIVRWFYEGSVWINLENEYSKAFSNPPTHYTFAFLLQSMTKGLWILLEAFIHATLSNCNLSSAQIAAL